MDYWGIISPLLHIFLLLLMMMVVPVLIFFLLLILLSAIYIYSNDIINDNRGAKMFALLPSQ